MKKFFLYLLVIAAVNVSIAWSFELSPVTRFQPLSPEEQKIEKDVMKYGYPDTAALRYRTNYVLSYDGRTRTAHWVCEHLNVTKLEGPADRKKCKFKEDTSIPIEYRSTLADYKNSGFDRGHLAPAGDHKYEQQAMCDTFYLSNMSPQFGMGFNRDYWEKLEEKVRAWAHNKKDLYVYTGPLYVPAISSDGGKYITYQVIGENNVAVPTHFFKVILAENEKDQIEMMAFIVPNQETSKTTPLSKFLVSVKDVERLSGLDFFNVLDKETEDKMEAAKPTDVW